MTRLNFLVDQKLLTRVKFIRVSAQCHVLAAAGPLQPPPQNTLYIATTDHSRHTTRHQLLSSLLPLTMPNVRLKPGDHVSAYSYEWDEPGGEDDDYNYVSLSSRTAVVEVVVAVQLT